MQWLYDRVTRGVNRGCAGAGAFQLLIENRKLVLAVKEATKAI
jgi:hypothetical protein